MSQITLETLKWIIGIPAALVALVTFPYVIAKYRLECRKLRCEVRKLEAEVPCTTAFKATVPGPISTWMAFYWPIPCYASGLVLALFAATFRSMILGGIAVGTSLMLLIIGSAVAERHTRLTGQRTR